MKKYAVYDSTNTLLRVFDSLKEATAFKLINNRFDWRVQELKKAAKPRNFIFY